MLSGEEFEKLDDSGAVYFAARKLAHLVGETAYRSTDLEIGFRTCKVYEYNEDGEKIAGHIYVYAKSTANLALTAHATAVVLSSRNPEEQAERERNAAEIQRKARVERITERVRAAQSDERVLKVLELLDGDPNDDDLFQACEHFKHDVKQSGLSRYALNHKHDFYRFTWKVHVSHHAVPRNEPPSDPMTSDEARRFIKEVANKWFKDKAEGQT